MAQSGLTSSVLSRGPVAGAERAPAPKLFGLIEIDQAGTVLYTRFEGDGAAAGSQNS